MSILVISVCVVSIAAVRDARIPSSSRARSLISLALSLGTRIVSGKRYKRPSSEYSRCHRSTRVYGVNGILHIGPIEGCLSRLLSVARVLFTGDAFSCSAGTLRTGFGPRSHGPTPCHTYNGVLLISPPWYFCSSYTMIVLSPVRRILTEFGREQSVYRPATRPTGYAGGCRHRTPSATSMSSRSRIVGVISKRSASVRSRSGLVENKHAFSNLCIPFRGPVANTFVFVREPSFEIVAVSRDDNDIWCDGRLVAVEHLFTANDFPTDGPSRLVRLGLRDPDELITN